MTFEKILGTRGFTRASSNPANVGMQGWTLHRQEVPYGARPGWYLAYEAGSQVLQILGSGIWIQQTPGGVIEKQITTFGGAETTSIPVNSFKFTDPIDVALLPGAVVWTTQGYRSSVLSAQMPYQTLMNVRESSAGLEDNDGCLLFDYNASVDHRLTGGFDHSAIGAMNAGLSWLCLGYRNSALVGLPHPSYTGRIISLFWTGDSITIYDNDFEHDGTRNAFRGYVGRYCGNRIPFITYGIAGGNSAGIVPLSKTPIFRFITERITGASNAYGVNEIVLPQFMSVDAMWTLRKTTAAVFHAIRVPLVHSTLTPRGGGYAPENEAQFLAARAGFNNKVRRESRSIPGVIGYFDMCKNLEVDYLNNTNVWVAANQGDLLHPNSTCHQLGADAISPHLFDNAFAPHSPVVHPIASPVGSGSTATSIPKRFSGGYTLR